MNKPQLALQLYTLREQLAEDFDGTLQRVADVGYRHVETAFFPEGISIEQAKRALDGVGLSVCSAHVELPLGDEQSNVLALAETFETDRIIWHGWPRDDRYDTVDGIKRLVEQYNRANEIAVANGLKFGLHNHWWECEEVEGQRAYQIFLRELDPRIFFELDLYWATVAGLDGAALVREMGSRAPFLHVKDGPATRHDPMVAVGDGTLDFPAILGAAEGNAEWLVVELDECATNMLTAVERSYRYLVDEGFVRVG